MCSITDEDLQEPKIQRNLVYSARNFFMDSTKPRTPRDLLGAKKNRHTEKLKDCTDEQDTMLEE